jgi:hypothetical protein
LIFFSNSIFRIVCQNQGIRRKQLKDVPTSLRLRLTVKAARVEKTCDIGLVGAGKLRGIQKRKKTKSKNSKESLILSDCVTYSEDKTYDSNLETTDNEGLLVTAGKYVLRLFYRGELHQCLSLRAQD